MKIGITYDLKAEAPPTLGRPDDFQEEFDSPATIEALATVFRGLGYQVEQLGDGRELLKRLLADPPEFVFNLAEGQGVGRAREARVPAVLEMLGIPYTGSDPLTLAVTLDKDCAKRLVASAGVAVPGGFVVSTGQDARAGRDRTGLSFPLIVKPAWEGSSKGIRGTSVVDDDADLLEVVAALQMDHQQPVLVEEFIQGDELTVGVLGNDPPQVLGIMRVLPQRPTERFVYSLEVKRDYERQVRYECPAQLAPAATEAVRQAALLAYEVLGCRDVSRLDFRLRAGVPYFLEVNPLPGLNPESGDLVILARHCGWSHARLVAAVLDAAVQRVEKQDEERGTRSVRGRAAPIVPCPSSHAPRS